MCRVGCAPDVAPPAPVHAAPALTSAATRLKAYRRCAAARSAPTLAENGEEGAELWADLELQLVADVGIVGVPNAGKSTLLGVVSAARPKVADYPFTTLVPNLGVCELDFRTTVFADVPGAAAHPVLIDSESTPAPPGRAVLWRAARCDTLWLRVLHGVRKGERPSGHV